MATFLHATYEDLVGELEAELGEGIAEAERAGVAREAIVLDPGIGFAKRGEQSLKVLASLPRIAALGFPVMVGASRKRFIGEVTGVRDPSERLFGTIGAHVAALTLGARLFRVHDVVAHRHALDVAWAVMRGGGAS
jgi:dihydropteroate synthase